MTLRIGNSGIGLRTPLIVYLDGSRSGFTLVEVMAAAAILMLGVVLIYRAFFTVLDASTYCSDYLSVTPWVDEKMWEISNTLSLFDPPGETAAQGDFVKNGRRFNWDTVFSLSGATSDFDIYDIEMGVSWNVGKRAVRLTRSGCALRKKETLDEAVR